MFTPVTPSPACSLTISPSEICAGPDHRPCGPHPPHLAFKNALPETLGNFEAFQGVKHLSLCALFLLSHSVMPNSFFSRGSSQSRDQTLISYTAGGFFTIESLGKDREVWLAAVHGVAKSWTWLSDWTTIHLTLIVGNLRFLFYR